MIEQSMAHKKKLELFRQNALQAWKNCQATGFHATAEETDAWLAKLEAGEKPEGTRLPRLNR
jgi:predicted transcriptional regulator